MALDFREFVAGFSPERQARIERRADAMIAKELARRDLRKARRKTEESLARELGISRERLATLEQRSDLFFTTLRSTVERMGGTLSLVARFPEGPPVEMSGLWRDGKLESGS